MSLLKRVKESKVAEVDTRQKESRHPIVEFGADRNVREAYLHGLVFAGFANDDKIDEVEKAWLVKIGGELGFPIDDINRAIDCVGSADDAGKMALIEECARQIVNPKISERFIEEFATLWELGGGKKEEFAEFRGQLIAWTEKESPKEDVAGSDKQEESDEEKPQKKSAGKPAGRRQIQEQLLRSLDRIAREFEWRRSIPLETIETISRRMNKFDPEKINWPRVVNHILKEEEDAFSPAGSRQAIWKVLGLLLIEYEADGDNLMIDELRGLYCDTASENFTDKLRRVIARYLKDRVSF